MSIKSTDNIPLFNFLMSIFNNSKNLESRVLLTPNLTIVENRSLEDNPFFTRLIRLKMRGEYKEIWINEWEHVFIIPILNKTFYTNENKEDKIINFDLKGIIDFKQGHPSKMIRIKYKHKEKTILHCHTTWDDLNFYQVNANTKLLEDSSEGVVDSHVNRVSFYTLDGYVVDGKTLDFVLAAISELLDEGHVVIRAYLELVKDNTLSDEVRKYMLGKIFLYKLKMKKIFDGASFFKQSNLEIVDLLVAMDVWLKFFKRNGFNELLNLIKDMDKHHELEQKDILFLEKIYNIALERLNNEQRVFMKCLKKIVVLGKDTWEKDLFTKVNADYFKRSYKEYIGLAISIKNLFSSNLNYFSYQIWDIASGKPLSKPPFVKYISNASVLIIPFTTSDPESFYLALSQIQELSKIPLNTHVLLIAFTPSDQSNDTIDHELIAKEGLTTMKTLLGFINNDKIMTRIINVQNMTLETERVFQELSDLLEKETFCSFSE